MYNSKKPIESELPTSKQLFKSTVLAFVLAIVVLIVIVLPAEYAIDITGLGRVLGLTEMGTIKTELITENKKEASKQEVVIHTENESILNTKSILFDLEPGKSVEYKLEMEQGKEVTYLWSVVNGVVTHDTHGDGLKGSKDFISYQKGKGIQKEEGILKAAFTGHHGWYWKNKGSKTVKITLYVNGHFKKLKRMM